MLLIYNIADFLKKFCYVCFRLPMYFPSLFFIEITETLLDTIWSYYIYSMQNI